MKKLTKQQLLFCEEYVINGYKGSDAYSKAYASETSTAGENQNMCRVEAWRMLRNERILDEIKRIEGTYKAISLEKGVDKKYIIDNLKMGMEATNKLGDPDYTARNNATNTWAKLTGEFEAEKKHIVIDDESELTKDPSKMTKEEIKEYKDKILKTL